MVALLIQPRKGVCRELIPRAYGEIYWTINDITFQAAALDPFGKDPHTTSDVMFILYEIVF